MPAIATAAVSAITTYVGGAFAATASGTATLAQAATVIGVNLAASAAVNAAATALLQPNTGAEGSPLEWRADPTAGVPIALGRVAAAGRIVHRDEWGADNRYQSIWTVCSGCGPIQQIEGFFADDVAVSFGANGAARSGAFADKMWLQTKLGNATDTALAQTGLPKASPGYEGWGASKALPYRAACQLTLFQDSKFKSYPSGEPRTRLTLKGIKLYDPRLDSTVPGGSGSHRWGTPNTYTYSDNAALLALNWAMGLYEGSMLVGGIGAGSAGVHLPAFMEWANVCDTNGWVASAYASSLDDRHQVLLGLMQAGGARYARFAGKISCIVSAPKSSVVTLSVDDTAGPFEIAANADRLDKINTLVPTCRMESHNWEDVPQNEISVASYVTADGGVIDRDLSYPFVALHADGSNRDQVAELAAYAILDSREPFSGTVPLKPWAMQIEPGDVFTITEPGFLLDAVELKCLSRSFDPMTNIVRVSFISESAGKHDFALGRTNTPPEPAQLTVPDIFNVPAPDTAEWQARAGQGNVPTIEVTGDADRSDAEAFVVEFRRSVDPDTGAAWTDDEAGWRVFGQFGLATQSVVITGLEPETAYQVGIRYVSRFGVRGERGLLGEVTTGAHFIKGGGDPVELDRIIRGLEDGRRQLKEVAEALYNELWSRVKSVDDAEDAAVNLFVEERESRISESEAFQSNFTAQISAVGQSLGAVTTQVTTLANNLGAETQTLRAQFSGFDDSLSAALFEIGTLADQLQSVTTAFELLESDIGDPNDGLSAVAADLRQTIATLEERTAARLIQVGADSTSARIRMVAQSSGGLATSSVVLEGQTIGFAPDGGPVLVEFDMVSRRWRAFNQDRSVALWEVDFASGGRIRLRDSAGQITYDSAQGGVQGRGFAPGAMGVQRIAEGNGLNLYLNSTMRKFVEFNVETEIDGACLSVNLYSVLRNYHNADVHFDGHLTVNGGADGHYYLSDDARAGLSINLIGGLTTRGLPPGHHTIALSLRAVGAFNGSSLPANAIALKDYAIGVELKNRRDVQVITNATLTSPPVSGPPPDWNPGDFF